MNIQKVYNYIIDLNNSKPETLVAVRNLCALLRKFCDCRSVRLGFDGEWYCSNDFSPQGVRKVFHRVIGTNNEIVYELYLDDETTYKERLREGSLDTVLSLIDGYLSNIILSRVSYEHRERKKELQGLNRTSKLLEERNSIEDTLREMCRFLPDAWQYPESTMVRIIYDNKVFTSVKFYETPWVQSEKFERGAIEIFYSREYPNCDEGPFLKEERNLLKNLVSLITAIVARDLYKKTTSGSVSDDFRKTLTRDKQPLQLFFNKQIIEKYVYLDMMRYKIKNILFVATLYDAFVLETDDSFFEQFMGEIYQYSLFSLPRITGVTSSEEALELMDSTHFDLAILMVGLDKKVTLELASEIKKKEQDLKVFLLLNHPCDGAEVKRWGDKYDKLFVWSGNSQILFSIVKSIEDHANVENDTKIGLVRVILLVEDSPEYYSKYLQILFGIVFSQVQKLLMEDERNEINKISKMRQRPKILHATTYEEAWQIYDQYRDFMMCVISDVEFEKEGEMNHTAGVSLCRNILSEQPTLPIMLQSADKNNRRYAEQLGVAFQWKDSPVLFDDLLDFLHTRLWFGDFFFRNHSGKALARAVSLKEFEIIFRNIPSNLLGEYGRDNRISSWIMSRGEIPLARQINNIHYEKYGDVEEYRGDILKAIDAFRENRRRGRRIDFDDIDTVDEKNIISLSSGSLGGKGRGLAFINTLIQNIDTAEFDDEISIRMPITAIIGTDEFTDFIGKIDKSVFAEDYRVLREEFARTALSKKLTERLYRFLSQVKGRPIAVRSSSLSEDSLGEPFAGVFDTYIVPNNRDIHTNVEMVATAVKMVFASIYSDSSRAYFATIKHNIEDEKMAVILQTVVGEEHNGYFYPEISGTAQSYNYYPVAHMKAEEGVAVAGFGLGYYVVGGNKAYRFSPVWPNIDTCSTNDMVKNSQVEFLAIDLNKEKIDYIHDGEDAPLATLDVLTAEKHGTLKHCASVYNAQNDTIEAGLSSYGPRIVNFANILRHNYLPLARLLTMLLNTAKEALGTPVEIEWAVDLEEKSFYLLQIKPIISAVTGVEIDVERPNDESLILYSENSLGNGVIDNIEDIIYVDTGKFNKLETLEMAKEIEQLNQRMMEQDRHYILIGPGRWGTRDRFIGIPVQWSQISMAKVIVEMALENFPLESSMGSHFFHNVTSMGIGYMSTNDINFENIEKMEMVEQTQYFRHMRGKGIVVKMDGREKRGSVEI